MSWKNPDNEIHLIGWPALIMQVCILIMVLEIVIKFAMWLFR